MTMNTTPTPSPQLADALPAESVRLFDLAAADLDLAVVGEPAGLLDLALQHAQRPDLAFIGIDRRRRQVVNNNGGAFHILPTRLVRYRGADGIRASGAIIGIRMTSAKCVCSRGQIQRSRRCSVSPIDRDDVRVQRFRIGE